MVISENCCNLIVFNYKVLQTIIAMITDDKVTELFCMSDDFCKFFDAMMEKYTLKSDTKRRYHRDSTMSKAEIMLIMILFHDSGYRCLKHFYLAKVCRHLRHLFPKIVSYNRFVELEKEVAVPLALFGQHPVEGMQESKDTYPQGIQGYSPKGQVFHGMVFRFQTAFDM